MSILFRCPCGRSMVADSERAGEVVTCPNCKRALKVPTGKDRGVELAPVPASAKLRTSRTCQRCRKEIPVDVQMCPYCKAILMDAAGGAAAPAAGTARPASQPGARKSAASGAGGTPIVYGGNRGSWWSQMSPGGKAGVIGGIAAAFLLFIVVLIVVGKSHIRDTIVSDRGSAQQALDAGRGLEAVGKFQAAYDLYSLSTRDNSLRNTGQASDVQLADAIKQRYNALTYLAPDPQLRKGESVYWKPKDQVELDQQLANLRAGYEPYRQLALAITSLAMPATKDAQTTPDKAAYEAKTRQVMDAYVTLVAKSTPQQRATYTFQQIDEGIRYMTGALRNWDKPDRGNYLVSGWNYFDACRERLEMTEAFGDNFWPR
jgi:hypothetical protein